MALLAFFAAWQAPFSTINRSGPSQEWAALTRFCMRLWAILMLPLYIVLQSALLAGLDHAGGQWRSILARPLSRWTFYATKLTFVIGLAVAGSALLAQPEHQTPGPFRSRHATNCLNRSSIRRFKVAHYPAPRCARIWLPARSAVHECTRPKPQSPASSR